MSATRLDQSHAALIQGFLERDPVANIFALGALEQWAVERNPSVEWWGTMGPDGELDALVFAEGHRVGLGYALVVPMGCAEALADMAPRFSERDGASWMVGEAAAASHELEARPREHGCAARRRGGSRQRDARGGRRERPGLRRDLGAGGG